MLTNKLMENQMSLGYPINNLKAFLVGIMLFAELTAIAMKQDGDIPLTVFKDKVVIDENCNIDDTDHITNLFLHNLPVYQNTYAQLPDNLSHELSGNALRELLIKDWIAEKLSLSTVTTRFFSHHEAPSLPQDALTVTAFNRAGDMIALGTRLGKLFVYELENDQWNESPTHFLPYSETVSFLHFYENKLVAINSEGKMYAWKILPRGKKPCSLVPIEEKIVIDSKGLAADRGTKMHEKIDFLAHLNADVSAIDAQDHVHGFKRVLPNDRAICDCQLDAQNGLLYLLIGAKDNAKSAFYKISHRDEFVPELRIYDTGTNELIHAVQNADFQMPILLNKNKNRLFMRKQLWAGDHVFLYETTDLISLHEYFKNTIRLEHALLLSIIQKEAKHNTKFDFNAFPHMWNYYQQLPPVIKKTLNKLVIQPGESKCTIL